MSLDVVDAAFVHRLAVGPSRKPSAPGPQPRPAPRPPVAAVPVAVATESTAATPAASRSTPERRAAEHPMVERLLALAPEEWKSLTDHVEAARQRGRRVIAVAGGRAGEGRTTLVRCLAATLRARGREVRCVEPHEIAVAAAGSDGLGPTHDKRIVLVDAGIWFPPGPIRRSLVQVVSLGCEAAILVRRAGASGGLARQAALEALGIEVLGEVLTFSRPLSSADTPDGGAAA